MVAVNASDAVAHCPPLPAGSAVFSRHSGNGLDDLCDPPLSNVIKRHAATFAERGARVCDPR
jgi:hypothetical protein